MKHLLHQAVRFVGLSGIGWLLDMATYTILGFFSKNLFVNNYISSWVGVTFVFIFSTRMVFRNNSKIPLKAKYVIYLVYQVLLILVMSKLLTVINAFLLAHVTWELVTRFASIISKILITPITMVLNFFVMKGIIERI